MQICIDLGHRFPNHRFSWLVLHVLLASSLVVAVLPATPAQAAAKRTDKREIEARQAFASGQYQQALDLYAELYAEKVHPTYLRNIGRCYQNLRQPEKAVNAFRDYLRQAKQLTPAERSEVDGYIKEMEDLRKQQEAEAAAASAPAMAPTAPPPTVPVVPPVAPEARGAQEGGMVTDAVPPQPPAPTPFYKKAWFWSVVGVAVVGGVVAGLYAGGAFSKSTIACTAKDNCY